VNIWAGLSSLLYGLVFAELAACALLKSDFIGLWRAALLANPNCPWIGVTTVWAGPMQLNIPKLFLAHADSLPVSVLVVDRLSI
jgi:hypothetical protein